MKINKATQNGLIVVLGLIFITGLYEYGTRQYYYWIQGKDKEGYDVLNASINVALGILHIITIAFLAVNYWIQRGEIKKRDKEIDESKRDIEYNRVLENVYRQLEFTRISDLGDQKLNRGTMQNRDVLSSLFGGITYSFSPLSPMQCNVYLPHSQDLTHALYADIKFYSELIYNSTHLNAKQQKLLTEVVKSNYLNKFITTIENVKLLFTYTDDTSYANNMRKEIRGNLINPEPKNIANILKDHIEIRSNIIIKCEVIEIFYTSEKGDNEIKILKSMV